MPDNPTLLDYDFVYCGDADEWFAAQTTKVTLRDLFAGLAMLGMCASPGDRNWAVPMGEPQEKAFAEWAYRQADAMLAERARG